MSYASILDFWFTELTPKQWFSKDLALDAKIKQRFGGIHNFIHAIHAQ